VRRGGVSDARPLMGVALRGHGAVCGIAFAGQCESLLLGRVRLLRWHRARLRGRAHAARRACVVREIRWGRGTLPAPWGGAAPGPRPAQEARMRSPKEENHARKQLTLEQYAWANRQVLTPSEARLWSALSARKLGVQFRRQVPLAGRYIVDFCAPSVRLVVEVDGAGHALRRRADARRRATRCGAPAAWVSRAAR
jgi:very-short-patch-repair endonuclease